MRRPCGSYWRMARLGQAVLSASLLIGCLPATADAEDTLLAKVSTTTLANQAYWAAQCEKIPATTPYIKVVMGYVTDYFKPTKGNTYCDMLQSNDMHQWSPNGVKWFDNVKPYKPYGIGQFGYVLGGSAAGYPIRVGSFKGDKRYFLSQWGQEDTVGGCCSDSYADENSGYSKAFDMYYGPPADILLTNVAVSTLANDAFWAKLCVTIPANTRYIKVVMGSVTDFFKATKGYTYCDMLQAANKHLWSPDGVEWYAVKFDSRAGGSYNGGSALGWPRGNGLEGDERQYLSMWGSNYGQNGGCCSTSYSESKTGNFPIAFDMYYSPDAVPLPVGVTLLADVAATTLANSTYWAEQCVKIPPNTPYIMVVMGSVIDYFAPVEGATYCDMLVSSNKHTWSADGETWDVPDYYPGSSGFFGGSAQYFPRDNIGGDERLSLSCWGSNHGENVKGGCCSDSRSVPSAGWGKAFDMYYGPSADILLTNVAATTVANSTYWAEQCETIPPKTTYIKVVMGNVTDYFAPIDNETTYCDMLQSNHKHTWSADGKDWQVPDYYGDGGQQQQSYYADEDNGSGDQQQQYIGGEQYQQQYGGQQQQFCDQQQQQYGDQQQQQFGGEQQQYNEYADYDGRDGGNDLGGSAMWYPADNTEGDGRMYLSIWGSDEGSSEGGCCSYSSFYTCGFGKAFAMYYSPLPTTTTITSTTATTTSMTTTTSTDTATTMTTASITAAMLTPTPTPPPTKTTVACWDPEYTGDDPCRSVSSGLKTCSTDSCSITHTFSGLDGATSALLTIEQSGDVDQSGEHTELKIGGKVVATCITGTVEWNTAAACTDVQIAQYINSGSVTVEVDSTDEVNVDYGPEGAHLAVKMHLETSLPCGDPRHTGDEPCTSSTTTTSTATTTTTTTTTTLACWDAKYAGADPCSLSQSGVKKCSSTSCSVSHTFSGLGGVSSALLTIEQSGDVDGSGEHAVLKVGGKVVATCITSTTSWKAATACTDLQIAQHVNAGSVTVEVDSTDEVNNPYGPESAYLAVKFKLQTTTTTISTGTTTTPSTTTATIATTAATATTTTHGCQPDPEDCSDFDASDCTSTIVGDKIREECKTLCSCSTTTTATPTRSSTTTTTLNATQLVAQNITASLLKENNMTAAELLSKGFLPRTLVSVGYTEAELREAGLDEQTIAAATMPAKQPGGSNTGAAVAVPLVLLALVCAALAVYHRSRKEAGQDGDTELQQAELRRSTHAMEENPMSAAAQARRSSSATTTNNPGFVGTRSYENTFAQASSSSPAAAAAGGGPVHSYENHAPGYPSADYPVSEMPTEYNSDNQVPDALVVVGNPISAAAQARRSSSGTTTNNPGFVGRHSYVNIFEQASSAAGAAEDEPVHSYENHAPGYPLGDYAEIPDEYNVGGGVGQDYTALNANQATYASSVEPSDDGYEAPLAQYAIPSAISNA